MHNIKQKLQDKVSKIVTDIAVKEMDIWPPICHGLFYQPERPQQPEKSDEADK